MILSYVWVFFICTSFAVALYQYWVEGNVYIFQTMVNDLFTNSTAAVMKIALPLVGIMAFWLGIMKIAESAGLVAIFSKKLYPFFANLFPGIPKDHPAVGHMTMNFSANLLGLDNAATPFGLKAMQSLQEINVKKQIASNAQIMFILLHASGLTLIPVSVMAQRAIYGAANPSDVFIPIAISTTFTTLVSLLVTSFWQGIRLKLNFVLGLVAFVGFLACFVAWMYVSIQSGEREAQTVIQSLPATQELQTWDKKHWETIIPNMESYNYQTYPLTEKEIDHVRLNYINNQKNQFNLLLSNIILLLIPVSLILYGLKKKRNVFEDFVQGAKESFTISIKIIPYLVGLLVAIGLLRSSGTIDVVVHLIQQLVQWSHINSDFVPSLSTALMKPLSGSGARAMMIETLQTYGADSFVGKLSSIFQGTSDTLLYIVALYFGSVGIRQTRYTVLLGLGIDLIGIIGAIIIGYWFFN